jgi:cytochrome c oxidase subunit 4
MSEHHVTSLRTYTTIFVILIALTLLTVVTALQPLGHWHTPVALGIAFAKAVLVFLFFMHLLHSPKLVWLVAGGTMLWLAIMFALTLADYWTRGMIEYR